MKNGESFEELADILETISSVFSDYGSERETEKYVQLTMRLRNGDVDALHMTKAEAYGAMGWGLGDRYFSRKNGDPVTQNEEYRVNAHLLMLLAQLNEKIEHCLQNLEAESE